MEAVLLTHGMKLRGGGYSTTSTLPDGSPGRRIALAITGQLMRTELASKVHNFVEPNRAHGVDTVMFLALMDRHAQSTVYSSDYGRSKQARSISLPPIACRVELVEEPRSSSCLMGKKTQRFSCIDGRVRVQQGCHGIFRCGNPPSLISCQVNGSRSTESHASCRCPGPESDAADAGYPSRSCDRFARTSSSLLRELAIANVTVGGSVFRNHSISDDVPGQVFRWVASFKHGNAAFDPAALAKAHFETSWMRREAAIMIERFEVTHRRHFDVVVWLREDNIVVLPYIVPDSLLATDATKSESAPCWTKACFNWGGLHDKAMMCPRVHMQVMLRALGEDSLTNRSRSFRHRWINEVLSRNTLLEHNVPSKQVDADAMPFVVARPPCYCHAIVTRSSRPCLRIFSDCVPPALVAQPADEGSRTFFAVPINAGVKLFRM